MPYCPECKFEYRPDINKCPDCDAWLVNSLEESSGQKRTSGAVLQARSPAQLQYSDELKRIMKSLPKGPAVPQGPSIPLGPLSPGSNKTAENYEPDPDSEIARKLDKYQTWIEIAHFPSEHISRVVSEGLESLSIPCVVMPGSRAGAVFGELYGGLMRTHNNDILLVPEEFVEKADIEAAELLGEAYEQFKTPNS